MSVGASWCFVCAWTWLSYSCSCLWKALTLALISGVVSLAAVATYRLCLHPLSRVPGPPLAAVTSCWYAFQVRNGRMLTLGKTLHEQYGPVVRVGPNELWFAAKDAFKMIYSEPDPYARPTARHPITCTPDELLLTGPPCRSHERL